MMDQPYPILEHDDTRPALIEPGELIPNIGAPESCVLCFFQEVIDTVCTDGTVIRNLRSEIGPHPVHEITVAGQRLAVCHPGVGAPLAAGVLEELIALGCRKFIACGGAGVIVPDMAVGHVVIPTAAVRDEGTSYHYLPPGRETLPSAKGVKVLEEILTANNVPHLLGKTWTTDGIYRETPAKISRRRAEGCLTVEMEAAAFFAVAQFRSVTFTQLLYSGDDVSGETWDSRRWDKRTGVREKLFWLAAEAALKLQEETR